MTYISTLLYKPQLVVGFTFMALTQKSQLTCNSVHSHPYLERYHKGIPQPVDISVFMLDSVRISFFFFSFGNSTFKWNNERQMQMHLWFRILYCVQAGKQIYRANPFQTEWKQSQGRLNSRQRIAGRPIIKITQNLNRHQDRNNKTISSAKSGETCCMWLLCNMCVCAQSLSITDDGE